MQLVVVETIQLDISHDGALYHCLLHGFWPNRVILAPPSMILLLILRVRPQFVPWFWQRFADYYGKQTFVHQVRGESKSVAWSCDTLIESTRQNATKELDVPLIHPRTNRMHCLLHAQLIDTVRVLPTDITTMHLPPVVNISLQNGQAGDGLE